MTTWKRCRKLPVVVRFREATGEKETIHTREGTLTATQDDYIIEGVRGEIYPIGKDIFHETYEVLE